MPFRHYVTHSKGMYPVPTWYSVLLTTTGVAYVAHYGEMVCLIRFKTLKQLFGKE